MIYEQWYGRRLRLLGNRYRNSMNCMLSYKYEMQCNIHFTSRFFLVLYSRGIAYRRDDCPALSICFVSNNFICLGSHYATYRNGKRRNYPRTRREGRLFQFEFRLISTCRSLILISNFASDLKQSIYRPIHQHLQLAIQNSMGMHLSVYLRHRRWGPVLYVLLRIVELTWIHLDFCLLSN